MPCSLGERRYLEIIAPDPAQDKVRTSPPRSLKARSRSPLRASSAGPITRAILRALAAKLEDAGIAFDGPRDGSRARPDGRLLKWKTLNLADDYNGILPFFIEWDATSTHPSTDSRPLAAGSKVSR